MNQNLFKELDSLVPAQLDAGQVFTGTPTGKASKATRKRVRTPRPLPLSPVWKVPRTYRPTAPAI